MDGLARSPQWALKFPAEAVKVACPGNQSSIARSDTAGIVKIAWAYAAAIPEFSAIATASPQERDHVCPT